MEINITERTYRVALVSPQGRLDAFSAPQVKEQINRLCDEGVLYFVLDLSAVPFMDSSGVALLVSLLRRVRPAGGNVKLIRPTQDAGMRVLSLTKMDQVFTFVNSLDDQLITF